MKGLRIACTALTRRIVAGIGSADGQSIPNGLDVTSDCLKAVIDFVGVNKHQPVIADGVHVYDIAITEPGLMGRVNAAYQIHTMLLELCGSTQDGSDCVVSIYQDDATRSWHLDVGSKSYYGDSLADCVGKAQLENTPTH